MTSSRHKVTYRERHYEVCFKEFAFSCHVQSLMEISLIIGFAAGPALAGGLQMVRSTTDSVSVHTLALSGRA